MWYVEHGAGDPLVLLHPGGVDSLVSVAGVFHRDGRAPGVIDPDQPPPDFVADMYAELSPDAAGEPLEREGTGPGTFRVPGTPGGHRQSSMTYESLVL
jgi:hypothetical protein